MIAATQCMSYKLEHPQNDRGTIGLQIAINSSLPHKYQHMTKPKGLARDANSVFRSLNIALAYDVGFNRSIHFQL